MGLQFPGPHARPYVGKTDIRGKEEKKILERLGNLRPTADHVIIIEIDGTIIGTNHEKDTDIVITEMIIDEMSVTAEINHGIAEMIEIVIDIAEEMIAGN